MTDKPLARVAFDELAESYAARAETKAHNAFYDRPAMLALLPPVEGKRVLDAGCGPGIYARWLVERGAEVVGLDVSPRMVELANLYLQGKAKILQADLGEPLDFLESDSFNVVVSALALDYVLDWTALFKDFFRVLRAEGRFVFSVGHPADEFYEHHPSGNYFEIEQVEVVWKGLGGRVSIPYYRRPPPGHARPAACGGLYPRTSGRAAARTGIREGRPCGLLEATAATRLHLFSCAETSIQ